MKTSTLRPGFLVSLSSSQSGNVRYDKRVIEDDHIIKETGAQKAQWETTRIITDPEEHDRASKARVLARSAISKVCAHSAFGYLCPEDKADKLDEAIAESRRIVDEFNSTADLERVSVYVLVGRIAPDDVEAVKAINSEIDSLMRSMQNGLRNLDVKAIREAASKAKQVGQILSPDAQARVQLAIEAARESAKQIVKAGEQAAQEVDLATIKRIDEQRVAFLDLDGEREVAAAKQNGRAVDFEPVPQTGMATSLPKVLTQLDI